MHNYTVEPQVVSPEEAAEWRAKFGEADLRRRTCSLGRRFSDGRFSGSRAVNA